MLDQSFYKGLSVALMISTIVLFIGFISACNQRDRLKNVLKEKSIIKISDLGYLDNDFIISNDEFIVTIKRKKFNMKGE